METSVGGKIQGVSLDSFLQIVQMDRITCTLNIRSPHDSGSLFFVNGELFSAATNDLHDVEAACRIISWEETVIEIDHSCAVTENTINQPLMNLLMEGMRLRDEAAKSKVKFKPDPTTAEEPSLKSTAKSPVGSKSAVASATASSSPKTAAGPDKIAGHTGKRPKWKTLAIFAGLSLVIILCGLGLSFYLLKNKQMRQSYEAVLTKVETTIPLEKKIELLESYVRENVGTKFTADAEQRIKNVREQLLEQEFSSVKIEGDKLIQKGEFEKAAALYTHLEPKLSGSPIMDKLSEKKQAVNALIDKQAYQALLRISEGKGPERVTLYLDFLKKYPNCAQRPELEKQIANMSHEFYLYTEKQILESGKRENWQYCMDIIQQFFDIYPDSEHTGVLKKYQSLCEEEIIDANALKNLKKREDALGDDYEQILKLYTDYLRSYPYTHAKSKIDQEIERIKALAEKKRIALEIQKISDLLSGATERFIVNPNGTVKDRKTGMMWNLIDSTTLLNRCIDYKEAQTFVKDLTTGGYTDWRLPTPEELTALYRQSPPFPSIKPTWYWTSQTHKRYLGRWMVNVDVVSTETSTEEEIKNKESWHCGAVRAVRGNK